MHRGRLQPFPGHELRCHKCAGPAEWEWHAGLSLCWDRHDRAGVAHVRALPDWHHGHKLGHLHAHCADCAHHLGAYLTADAPAGAEEGPDQQPGPFPLTQASRG